MKQKPTKPTWLFSDLTLYDEREIDPFFKEFFAFVFRNKLSKPKRPLILVNISHIGFSVTPIDENGVVIIHSYEYRRDQINHGRDMCVIPWRPEVPDENRALFTYGFAAYALKNNIKIQRSALYQGSVVCNDYFPAVAWLKANRGSEDYDYIFGKLYEYVMTNDCLDKLLDFYDGLGDMEGKAEFLHYYGEHGTFEQVEMRL